MGEDVLTKEGGTIKSRSVSFSLEKQPKPTRLFLKVQTQSRRLITPFFIPACRWGVGGEMITDVNY